VDFQLTPEQQRLQNKCRELAAEFATRSATHDRDASHPIENYDRLREEGFLALTVGKEWGGSAAVSSITRSPTRRWATAAHH
jgi:alkylation response protein AidB-like acyl-CoA dehydrogenase